MPGTALMAQHRDVGVVWGSRLLRLVRETKVVTFAIFGASSIYEQGSNFLIYVLIKRTLARLWVKKSHVPVLLKGMVPSQQLHITWVSPQTC